MKYERLISQYCGFNLKKVTENTDIDGAMGVACMLAFLHGVDPKIESIANHLGVHKNEIKVSFEKLESSGVFDKGFNAREDKALIAEADRTSVLCAWGNIFGIASGLIQRSYSRKY